MANHFGSAHAHFESIESTHLHLMRRGNDLPSGTVITADYQEKGRGRHGRSWTASPGSSLLASFLLKPDLTANRAPELSHILSLACAQTLRQRGIDAYIRWPNDLVVNGKKLAGIISEANLDGDALRFVVLSVGINLNQTQQELVAIDRPATSCFSESGKDWKAQDVLEDVLGKLDELYTAYCEHGFAAIKAPWKQLSSITGKRIVLDLGARTIDGTVAGFDDDGAILLDSGGRVQRFAVGEVKRVEGVTYDI